MQLSYLLAWLLPIYVCGISCTRIGRYIYLGVVYKTSAAHDGFFYDLSSNGANHLYCPDGLQAQLVLACAAFFSLLCVRDRGHKVLAQR